MFRIAMLLTLAALTLPAQANDIFEYSKKNLKCLDYGVTGVPEFPFNASLITGYRRGQPGEYFVWGLRTYDLQKTGGCYSWPCPTKYEGRSDDGSSVKITVWTSGHTGQSGKQVEGSIGFRAFICDIR